jgi:hypothetical protein
MSAILPLKKSSSRESRSSTLRLAMGLTWAYSSPQWRVIPLAWGLL